MVSFEIFVKAMPPSLSELKVLPSFCFAFKIPDDVAASNVSSFKKFHIAFTILSKLFVNSFKIEFLEAVLQQFRYFVSWNSEASLRFCLSQWSFIMVDAASKNPNCTRPNLWKSGLSTCPRKAGSQAKTRLPVFPFPHYIHWKIWQVFLWGCPKVETVRCCFHLIRAEQARRLLHTACWLPSIF